MTHARVASARRPHFASLLLLLGAVVAAPGCSSVRAGGRPRAPQPPAARCILLSWTNGPGDLDFVDRLQHPLKWLLVRLPGQGLARPRTRAPTRPPRRRPRRTEHLDVPPALRCKWQNGVAFTAKDVAFPYNYIVDNQMGALSSLTTYITKAVAVDDTTVEIHCSRPRPMITTSIPILPEHIWGKVGPKAAGARTRTAADHRHGPSRRWKSRRATRAHGRNPSFSAPSRASTRTSSSPTRIRLDDEAPGRRHARRRVGHLRSAVPEFQSNRDFQAISYNLLTWDYLPSTATRAPAAATPCCAMWPSGRR